MNSNTVNIPCNAVLLPVEAVGVELLRSVKAKLVNVLMPAPAVCEIVELNYRCVLSQKLNINLVPRVIVGGTRVGKERRYHAVVLDGLHLHLIVAVAVKVLRAELCAGIRNRACVIVNGELHHAVLKGYISLAPCAVEH